jgi:gluconate kinase
LTYKDEDVWPFVTGDQVPAAGRTLTKEQVLIKVLKKELLEARKKLAQANRAQPLNDNERLEWLLHKRELLKLKDELAESNRLVDLTLKLLQE